MTTELKKLASVEEQEMHARVNSVARDGGMLTPWQRRKLERDLRRAPIQRAYAQREADQRAIRARRVAEQQRLENARYTAEQNRQRSAQVAHTHAPMEAVVLTPEAATKALQAMLG